jgi:hypothetical protein
LTDPVRQFSDALAERGDLGAELGDLDRALNLARLLGHRGPIREGHNNFVLDGP